MNIKIQKKSDIILIVIFVCVSLNVFSDDTSLHDKKKSPAIEINGINFTLNKLPFSYRGISFFNALYNPAFNKSKEEQINWLKKLNNNGITVLRIWAEWNNSLGFIDACDSCIIYNRDGSLRPFYFDRLKSLLDASASLDMVIEYVFFSSESKGNKLNDEAANRAIQNITRELIDYRNLVFQIWNEHDYRVADYYKIIKQIDSDRLVSNSPGGGGTLGSDEHNELLDFLTPHTSRHGKHWEKVGEEIGGLIKKFNKPVVDDEPARSGTRESEWLGGPKDETSPFDMYCIFIMFGKQEDIRLIIMICFKLVTGVNLSRPVEFLILTLIPTIKLFLNFCVRKKDLILILNKYRNK